MTYSIVARDRETGQLGVAVQSHYFSVGPVVPWAEAGIGAVATQAFVDIGYGPRGLARMRAGEAPTDALRELVAADPGSARRQVALVDAHGNAAAHTGHLCIAEAGHRTGAGISVQANMMTRASVWPAMAAAYEAAKGDLAERLLAALDAAEAEGGDIRGRQSAALLVVPAAASEQPWCDRVFDLRVEDHPEPLAELRRLVRLRRAYAGAADARARFEADDWPVELDFWQALRLASAGELQRAREVLARLPSGDSRWRELARRLVPVGLLSAEVAEKLGV